MLTDCAVTRLYLFTSVAQRGRNEIVQVT